MHLSIKHAFDIWLAAGVLGEFFGRATSVEMSETTAAASQLGHACMPTCWERWLDCAAQWGMPNGNDLSTKQVDASLLRFSCHS